MATFNYQREMNEMRDLTIFKNAMEMYSLYECKLKKEKFVLKWLYVKNRDKFVRKFKLRYPAADDDEIKILF